MSQIERAKAGLNFAHVVAKDELSRARHVSVPGSDGKSYDVFIHRSGNCLECECQLVTGYGNLDCQGNTRSVCYHSLMAVMVAAKEHKMKIAFCGRDERAAQRLSHLGGRVVKIRSRQSGREVWGVVK